MHFRRRKRRVKSGIGRVTNGRCKKGGKYALGEWIDLCHHVEIGAGGRGDDNLQSNEMGKEVLETFNVSIDISNECTSGFVY